MQFKPNDKVIVTRIKPEGKEEDFGMRGGGERKYPIIGWTGTLKLQYSKNENNITWVIIWNPKVQNRGGDLIKTWMIEKQFESQYSKMKREGIV